MKIEAPSDGLLVLAQIMEKESLRELLALHTRLARGCPA